MIYQLIDYCFEAVNLLIIIRVVLSWIPHNDSHPIVYKIYEWSDPILRPFQNIVPAWRIGFDLSPMFALLALWILHKLVFMILMMF